MTQDTVPFLDLFADEIFAAAYAKIPAVHRALLKTCIARLHAWYTPTGKKQTQTITNWAQGFSSLTLSSPKKRCLLAAPANIGAATLLAAFVPALCAGVPEITVAFIGQAPCHDATLLALELAGQERVGRLAEKDFPKLAKQYETSQTCVLALNQTASLLTNFSGTLWSNPDVHRIGVLCTENGISLEAVTFAHPDASIIQIEATNQEPAQAIEQLLEAELHGVFASNSLHPTLIQHIPLLFGLGHEGCWLYPHLDMQFFRMQQVAWGNTYLETTT